MVDHTTSEAESLSFPHMFGPQTVGQRSTHDLYQHELVSSLTQFEVSNHHPCEASDGTGSTMNGTDQAGNASYWGNMSPVSYMALNRNKAPGMYDTVWNSHCYQQGVTESYDTMGPQRQKLDSFSEAFCGRSTSRIQGGGEQNGFNTPSNNSIPPSNVMSFPLVLSPPPTPLPPPSFSPPKRPGHCVPGQILSQSQMQTQTDGSLQFFPLSSPSTSRFNHPIWLQLPSEDTEGVDLIQPLSQDPNPSLVYSEYAGPHLKQQSQQKSTDCLLSFNHALAQHLHPQSCVQLQLGHEPGTSEDHMSWPQMGQSSSSGPSQQLSLHVQGSGLGEGLRLSCGPNFSSGSSDKPLGSSNTQNVPIAVYTGVPFNSVIQLGRELMETWEGTVSHCTPPPMLNPTRSGTGLFYNLLPPLAVENRALWTDERKDNDSHRSINIGPDFQAELPDLLEELWPDEPVREELLWKPWPELEQSDTILQHVENLLDLSASSVLPGGGANLELALHSLSRCQGNILEALEMLLFSNSAPSEDYHYSGTDTWTKSEQKLFHKAFTIYGKDFSFIQKMVPSVQKMLVNQTSIERLIHTPPLPTSFPCKQCGKMFYKIKSRNAHMKIHRQQQEDWREKLQIHPTPHHGLNLTRALPHPNQQLLTQTHHQNHILTKSLIQNLVQSQTQLAFLQSTKTEFMPKQQYQLYGSHPKSTDCAQSTSLNTSHWTSDMGLPAQPKDRWPVL
ncbi:uncharacterized protein si:dkey-19b23.10 isoform X3 [Triplophysa rosa]|uniref:uncharacterized protein si:dkey-19b23.10 isoform X3 n=1 Tax=Triplophysa rosa TaxID=992332 RepID=UPI00254634C7|nr:uncharacterized protein si:dkey-19b23.10 isoform X3 [Triplophysa rosa]